jgi:alpha-tubulin suppressor-like RCC1 family protein
MRPKMTRKPPAAVFVSGATIERNLGSLLLVFGTALSFAACHGGDEGQSKAAQMLSTLQQRNAEVPPGLAEGFSVVPGGLRARFGAEAGKEEARVVFPGKSTAPLHIEDLASKMAVEILLQDARAVAGQTAGGYVIYVGAEASGASVLHGALPAGAEDFIAFEHRPAKPEISYQVTLGTGVNGLRLVANTLEMVDADGAPRLRVAPPYVVGADGAQADATLSVEGCATDKSPAAPWGRPVTAPGAGTCTVRVSWNDEQVLYPALLDPRWTTTGSMATARQDHTATLLSTGKVLVAGGRSSPSGTTGLATAELFDRSTGTWAATAGMTGGRWLHSATQLGSSSNTTTSGKVLIAGGINGTASVSTAQLYSPSAGTWVAATALNAARHAHTATVLSDGRVLVAGGLNGTTVLSTAAVYSQGTSGSGTWTATGNMASARRFHSATLLSSSNATFNKKVLVAGGNSGGTTSLTSVQLFDGSSWTTTTALPSTREGQTATVLANGNVLVTGGKSGSSTLNTTLVFTIPASGSAATWTSAGTMTSARSAHTASLLPPTIASNGQVLVAGGSNGTSSLGTAELWNGTSTWTATTALPAAVQGHTATLLGNNMVLIAGGLNGSTTQRAAQLYDASFGLACTSNSQCATGFCVGGVCCNTACTGQCMECDLAGSVGTCSPKANGTACGDGNACTQTDTCQGGTCTGANPVTCTAQDACHTVGTCNPTTGACSNPQAPTGTPCPDGDLCNGTETCDQTGACVAGLDVPGCDETGPLAISTGYYHSCALLGNGTVQCWGDNGYGELGIGTIGGSYSTPITVPGLSGVTAVVSGASHSCALLSDRTVKCWGYNGMGQTGDQNSGYDLTPTTVAAVSGVVAISAGGNNTCAVLSNTTVLCWGYGIYGGLGNGQTDGFSAAPVAVSGLSGVVSVSVGLSNTCALLSNGTVRCWGLAGLLGDGTDTGTTTCYAPYNWACTPTPDTTPVQGLSGVLAISVGANFTCAHMPDHTVQCWGDNEHGQLGDGTTTFRASPVPVPNLNNVTEVSAGYEYACAVQSTGGVQCWGDNTSGQLGNAIASMSSTPSPIGGLIEATAVSAGAYFGCAFLPWGAGVRCWGDNSFEQLGDALSTSSTTVVPVVGYSKPVTQLVTGLDSPPTYTVDGLIISVPLHPAINIVPVSGIPPCGAQGGACCTSNVPGEPVDVFTECDGQETPYTQNGGSCVCGASCGQEGVLACSDLIGGNGPNDPSGYDMIDRERCNAGLMPVFDPKTGEGGICKTCIYDQADIYDAPAPPTWNGNVLCYRISNLSPFTPIGFLVTAANGVLVSANQVLDVAATTPTGSYQCIFGLTPNTTYKVTYFVGELPPDPAGQVPTIPPACAQNSWTATTPSADPNPSSAPKCVPQGQPKGSGQCCSGLQTNQAGKCMPADPAGCGVTEIGGAPPCCKNSAPCTGNGTCVLDKMLNYWYCTPNNSKPPTPPTPQQTGGGACTQLPCAVHCDVDTDFRCVYAGTWCSDALAEAAWNARLETSSCRACCGLAECANFHPQGDCSGDVDDPDAVSVISNPP